MSAPWEKFTGLVNSGVEKVSEVAQGASDFVGDVSSTVSKGFDAASSSAGQSYVRQFFDSGTWDESMFDEKEASTLSEIVKQQVGKGKSQISYKDYDSLGGKNIGYSMGVPDLSDPRKSLKMTIGKGAIVRDNEDNVMVVDEYDFSGSKGLNKLPIGERIQSLIDAVSNPDISIYGVAHLFAEAFGASEGEGASIRAKVGNSESLGLTPEQVSKLPTLEEYESKNKNRINKKEVKETPVIKEEPIKEPIIEDEPEVVEETSPAIETKTIKIKSGDTLSKIAKDNGTTVKALAALNNIKDTNKIYVGKELKLS